MSIDKTTLMLMDFIAAMNGGKRHETSRIDKFYFDFPDKTVVVDNFGYDGVSIDYRGAQCSAFISYYDPDLLDVGMAQCALKRGHDGLHKIEGNKPILDNERDGFHWDDVDDGSLPDPIVVGTRTDRR